MRTLLNLVLFTVGLLLSVSCMKSERILTGGGGGGNTVNTNGTAAVLSGDQRLFKALAALAVAPTTEIRDSYTSSSRAVMPFGSQAGQINPVNTYAGLMDAMRISLVAVNTGLANNGSQDNRDMFAPARGAAASFDEAAFLSTAELVGARILRRPLMQSEKDTLKTEIFDPIKANTALSATVVRQSSLTAMVATILVSLEGVSAN